MCNILTVTDLTNKHLFIINKYCTKQPIFFLILYQKYSRLSKHEPNNNMHLTIVRMIIVNFSVMVNEKSAIKEYINAY